MILEQTENLNIGTIRKENEKVISYYPKRHQALMDS